MARGIGRPLRRGAAFRIPAASKMQTAPERAAERSFACGFDTRNSRSIVALPPTGRRSTDNLKMLSSLLKRLASPPRTEAPADSGHERARLALAALLIRVARSDRDYAEQEKSQIDIVLSRRFGLQAGEAENLRLRAEKIEEEALDSVQFTRAIKDSVPFEERFGIVEELWEVALADGTRDHDEDGIMRLAVKLLGVNDRDSALARQSAAKRIG